MIGKGIHYAAAACAGLAGIALLALVGLLVASTMSRYLAGVPLADVEDLAGLLFVAIAFLPLAEADLADRQLRIQFIVRLLPAGWQKGLRACADGLTGLVAIVLAVETYDFAYTSKQFGSRVVGSDILLWPWMMLVPAGFALLAATVLFRLVSALAAARSARGDA